MHPTDMIPSLDNSYPSANFGVQLVRPKAFNCLAGTAPTIPAFTANAYQAQRVATQAVIAETVLPGSVIHLGDSITECFDVLNVSPYGVNFGIGGDTAEAILNRVSSLSPALSKARAVSLMVGINNLRGGGNVAATKDMLGRLFSWISGPLVWTKIIYTGPPHANVNANILDVNVYAASLLVGRPNCQIVDINPIVSPGGYLLNQYHRGDGLHLSQEGYKIWAAALRDAAKLV